MLLLSLLLSIAFSKGKLHSVHLSLADANIFCRGRLSQRLIYRGDSGTGTKGAVNLTFTFTESVVVLNLILLMSDCSKFSALIAGQRYAPYILGNPEMVRSL